MKYIKKHKTIGTIGTIYTRAMVIDVKSLNQMIIEEMTYRGFSQFDKDCIKMNHHIYFTKQPLSLSFEDETPVLSLKLKMYNHNRQRFDEYFYDATVLKKGFSCEHNFSDRHLLIVRILSDVFYKSCVIDSVRKLLDKDIIKNAKAFNNKWRKYLKRNAPGMQIENITVLNFLDTKFEKVTSENKKFSFSQIKVKFGTCRIYCNHREKEIWEKEVDGILNNQPFNFLGSP
jgi:hypothetical protein